MSHVTSCEATSDDSKFQEFVVLLSCVLSCSRSFPLIINHLPDFHMVMDDGPMDRWMEMLSCSPLSLKFALVIVIVTVNVLPACHCLSLLI